MPMRRVWSFFAFLAILVGVALLPRTARAQTPSITGLGIVQRCEGGDFTGAGPSTCNVADNAGNHPHPNGILDNTINFEDCEANLYYQFPLNIANPSSSYNLEAWVGSQDCSQLTNRQTTATSVCWPVANFVASLVNPYIFNVRVRDLANTAFSTTHPVGFVATGVANNDDAVCQSATQTGGTALSIYFFFADTTGNPYGSVQQYPINVDMRAGDVQGSISAGIGDTVLIVSVPQTTDPATQGYNVYCDPPPGHEQATETVTVDAATNNGTCGSSTPVTTASDAAGAVATADASEDAGDASGVADAAGSGGVPNDDAGGNPCGVPLNDAGIPSPGGCSSSSVLVPGGTSSNLVAVTDDAGNIVYVEAGGTTIVEEGGAAVTGGTMSMALQYNQSLQQGGYLCGYGSASSTSINVTGLKDGYYYNIGVAVVDGAGNVGPLSNVVCGEPVPVADFWRLYYDAGGRAGGGFCSLESVGMPAGTSGLGALMVASMVAMIRRRAKNERKTAVGAEKQS
jgi:hypothetical protein